MREKEEHEERGKESEGTEDEDEKSATCIPP